MTAPAQLPATPDASPALRRTRTDGWTPDRQRGFLEAIAEGCTVEEAARHIGMSATAAYSFRRRAPGAPFALGWAAANLLARERLAATLYARAIEGQVESFTRADGQTVTRHRFDNRLANAMLARLDRQAEAPGPDAAAARLVAQEFDAFLDVIDRDEGPARAGLFVNARAATAAELAPIAALARADLWLRTGAARANEVDIADLDPARRAEWTAEQWARAEAAGLLAFAPAPQLSKLKQPAEPEAIEEEEPDRRIWYEEFEGWRTDFPPPDDFDGEEDGEYGQDGYERTLTPEELAAIEAPWRAEVALRRHADINLHAELLAACIEEAQQLLGSQSGESPPDAAPPEPG